MKGIAGIVLGRLERYIKTDLRYLVSGSIWLGAVQVVGMISSLLIAIAFAHFLSKEAFGTYKYILSIATLISAFAYSGLSTSVVQMAAIGSPGILQRSFLRYLKGSGFIFLLSIGVALYYAIHGNVVLAIGFASASLFLPLIGAATLYDSYLQGKREFKESAFLGLFNTGVPALVLIVIGWLIPHPLPIILGYFICNAVVDYILYRYTLYKYPEPTAQENNDSDAYSTHLSVMNVLSSFSTQVDQILLFHLFGPEQLALYAYAIALPEQSKGFLKNIGALALPKFAQQTSMPTRRHVAGQMIIMSLAVAVPVAAYVVLAPYIFSALFPAYMGSVLYSQIFAISLIAGSNVIPVSYAQAQKDTKRLYRITIVTSLFQIVCIVVGGTWYGLLGVLLGRVFARFTSSIYTLIAAI